MAANMTIILFPVVGCFIYAVYYLGGQEAGYVFMYKGKIHTKLYGQVV
jgi:hypothetical protein